MTFYSSGCTFPIRVLIACFILVAVATVPDAVALDKRTFVHILPPGTNAFYLIIADTSMTTTLYNTNSQFQAKVENCSLLAKAVTRLSLSKNLELSFEVPYILERRQKLTDPSGTSKAKFDASGLGDTDIQLTWQWRDSRKGGAGFLTGIEFKFPTGDKDRGLGTGTWDTVLRSIVSYKTGWVFPYGMAIYTMTGTTKDDGVRTDPGNDLYLAAGLKSLFWHGLGFNLSAYRYIATSRTVAENNGMPAVMEKYDIPGWKIYGRYRVSKTLECDLFYERSNPEDHTMQLNGTLIRKQLDTKKRFGAMLKYYW